VSYVPTNEALEQRRWFSRKPLTDVHSHAHIMFPVVYDGGIPKCLCRLCTPAWDARDEEGIQTLYVKLLELHYSCLVQVVGTRGRA
jgi:hypothetical protein